MNKKLALFIAACAMAGLSACNESVPWTQVDCQDDDQRCDRNAVEVCVDGKWTVESTCTESQTCNAETLKCDEGVLCTTDAKRCATGDKAVEICKAGVWELDKQCAATEICNATTLVCDVAAVCTNDAKRCGDKVVEICKAGAWEIETQCGAAEVCNGTTFVCDATIVCTKDAKRCEANNVEICADNAWKIDTSCTIDQVCNAVDFICDTTCVDGATQCTADGKLNSCADNKWIISDCEAGDICLVGKTACEEKICEEGDIVCNDDDNGLLTCTNNVLVASACAGETLSCEAGVCVICMNDEKRCENNAVEVCAANVWKVETACGAKTCKDVTFTCEDAACTAGWKRCSGNVLQVCGTDGKYAAAEPAACAAGSVCLDGTANTASCVQCKANTDCAAVAGKPVCHSNNTCVACEAGSKKCDDTDGKILTCSAAGAWEAGVACDAGQTCVAGAKVCTAIAGYCTKNTDCKDPLKAICDVDYNDCVACIGGSAVCKTVGGVAERSVCVFGAWSDPEACIGTTPVCNAAGTVCAECAKDTDCIDTNKCNLTTGLCKAIPACTDYDVICDGNAALTCTVDKWIGETCTKFCAADYGCASCLNDTHCTVAGKNVCHPTVYTCVACTPATAKCEANKLTTCSSSGSWGAGVACGAGKECKDGASTCTTIATNVCVSGTDVPKCDAGSYMTCVSNTWMDEACIGVKPVCSATEGCVECVVAGDCKDSAKPVCTANVCVAAAECVDGVTPDKCVGNTYMTCVGTSWMDEICAGPKPVCSATEGCVECVVAGDCKDSAKPVCTANVCVAAAECVDGVTPDKCVGNTYMTCVGTSWMDEICEGTTPVCSAALGCVAAAVPAITWCNSQYLDATAKKSYGRILDPRTVKNAATIDAFLVCGKAGETIGAYSEMIEGTLNTSCTGCGENFEFMADLSTLGAGDYLCIWQFDVGGADMAFCQTNEAGVITSIATIPTATNAQEYTVTSFCTPGAKKCTGSVFAECNAAGTAFVDFDCATEPVDKICVATVDMCVQCTENSHCTGATPVCNTTTNVCEAASGGFDHTVDFDDCTTTGGYASGTCTNVTYVKGITPQTTELIDGSKALKLNVAGSATITAPNGVGKLSIDVKKVNTKNADVTISVGGVVVITEIGMTPDMLKTLVNNAVNASGAVDIVINTTERAVIDNLKWTDHI